MEMVNINIVDLVVDDERLTINSSVQLEAYDIRGAPTHLKTNVNLSTRTPYHRILLLKRRVFSKQPFRQTQAFQCVSRDHTFSSRIASSGCSAGAYYPYRLCQRLHVIILYSSVQLYVLVI